MQKTKLSTVFSGLILLGVVILFSGCQANSCNLEPCIAYTPPIQLVENLPSAFSPLTPDEVRRDWAKEQIIANNFAMELDFYRAITSYKRALFLIPSVKKERRMQIEYGILQCYYLGRKYQSVIDFFDKSSLAAAPADFPAFDDLIIMLEDSYYEIGEPEKACKLFAVIEQRNPATANKLQLYEDLMDARFAAVQARTQCNDELAPILCNFLYDYNQRALSVKKAQTLNALLPGAGYYYVGQKSTAMTSFIINSLFIAATYYFFDHGNIAAGIITASLESGWYFGGINGAGLAAKAYNESLYNDSAKELMVKQRLFPVLMLKYTF
jgi:hypothetical protein